MIKASKGTLVQQQAWIDARRAHLAAAQARLDADFARLLDAPR